MERYWAIVTLILGPFVGVLVARASAQLPEAAPAGRNRHLFAAVGCTLAAAWSALLSPDLLGLVGAGLGWLLLLLGMLDVEHRWLPHRLTVPLGLLGLAEAAALEPFQVVDRLIGAAAGFAILAGIAWAYRRLRGREGIGGGDFRLLAAAGAWVGWVGLPSVLLIAAAAGLAIAGAKLLTRRAGGWAEEVPFGAYMGVGLWLTWLYGPIGIGR